jgi:hypothetical protein
MRGEAGKVTREDITKTRWCWIIGEMMQTRTTCSDEGDDECRAR